MKLNVYQKFWYNHYIVFKSSFHLPANPPFKNQLFKLITRTCFKFEKIKIREMFYWKQTKEKKMMLRWAHHHLKWKSDHQYLIDVLGSAKQKMTVATNHSLTQFKWHFHTTSSTLICTILVCLQLCCVVCGAKYLLPVLICIVH